MLAYLRRLEGDGGERPRDPDEIDDHFRALLEGLRTTIPGVVVLFSFLLVLPLQASFGDLSGINEVVYYIAFSAAAGACVLLIAPSVHQRVRAPITGIKRTSWGHVLVAARMSIAGTVLFLIAISSVVYLVTSIVFSEILAVIATVVVGGLASWAWFYLPLISFEQDGEPEGNSSSGS